jgi:hypothetical protein
MSKKLNIYRITLLVFLKNIPFYKPKLDDEPLAVQLKEKAALECSMRVVGI